MTKFKALYIKLYRVRYGCTWRATQGYITKRYDPDNYSTNQIDGMLNCKEAMEFLNEREEDGWN